MSVSRFMLTACRQHDCTASTTIPCLCPNIDNALQLPPPIYCQSFPYEGPGRWLV